MSTFQSIDETSASRLLSQSDAHKRELNKDGWIDWDELNTTFVMSNAMDSTHGEILMYGGRYTWLRKEDQIFVRIVDNLVPCGWFSLDQVKRKLESLNNV